MASSFRTERASSDLYESDLYELALSHEEAEKRQRQRRGRKWTLAVLLYCVSLPIGLLLALAWIIGPIFAEEEAPSSWPPEPKITMPGVKE